MSLPEDVRISQLINRYRTFYDGAVHGIRIPEKPNKNVPAAFLHNEGAGLYVQKGTTVSKITQAFPKRGNKHFVFGGIKTLGSNYPALQPGTYKLGYVNNKNEYFKVDPQTVVQDLKQDVLKQALTSFLKT